MKTFISLFIFLFVVVGVSAQEASSITNTNDETAKTAEAKSNTATDLDEKMIKSIEEENICYGEISKVTFYEALLKQNDFDIKLKESRSFALRNTEDIIKSNKNRISYSE